MHSNQQMRDRILTLPFKQTVRRSCSAMSAATSSMANTRSRTRPVPSANSSFVDRIVRCGGALSILLGAMHGRRALHGESWPLASVVFASDIPS